ncbi:MAG: hypothetical protein IPM79_24685 [Polyangiaceae bacterium]|jgi:hypothetical protein|nr:hypothetical protein [Polyangiaceae bacterium]MBK8940725.1 hypothetical protein [Polyangiaceae bacterium]
MRNGLFLGALLATMFVGGSALAERNESDAKSSRGRAIKEQVLEKQKEGTKASSKAQQSSSRSGIKQDMLKDGRTRAKGEVFGDQATASSTKSRMSQAAGKNMSASGRVNTPAEVRAMMKMVNPMAGAYRTSQAAEGTDSYKGNEMSRISAGSGGSSGAKNHSATGKVNTPAEIKAFMKMINPLFSASSSCMTAEGADSYSKTEMSFTRLMNSGKGAQRNVHFKNERGEVVGVGKADTDHASKSKASREKLTNMVKEKLAKSKESK